jgi:BirA family biotin operon repressor/biotin-[acetyl-CoA-carboxylase] ligase
VALRAAVEEVSGLTTDVKWPNDLLAGGRKVCGILVEARGQAVVVGIGVNVCQDPALEADPVLGATATTIEAAAERPVDRARLARAALDALDEAVARLFAADFAPLERAFLEGLGCAGEPVRVVSGGKSLAGELLAIRFDEGVLLQTVNGVETLAAETITSLSRLRAS